MRRNRSLAHVLLVLALTCTTFAAFGGTTASAGTGIVARLVAGGLNGPAAFTFLSDGRIVYLERGTGQIHIYDPATQGDSRFFTIPARICTCSLSTCPPGTANSANAWPTLLWPLSAVISMP
jgi:hypothetical protein